jgi:hypothetical protein
VPTQLFSDGYSTRSYPDFLPTIQGKRGFRSSDDSHRPPRLTGLLRYPNGRVNAACKELPRVGMGEKGSLDAG